MLQKIISCVLIIVCAVTVLSGCGSAIKDNFYEGEMEQPIISTNVTMQTEFPEYDKNTEKIITDISNNSSDEEYSYNAQFFLQKQVDGEWRYIICEGFWELKSCRLPPSYEGKQAFNLKDHVKLPLSAGRYRLGFVVEHDTPVAEFTVK